MQDFLNYLQNALTTIPGDGFGWLMLIFLWITAIAITMLLIIGIIYLSDSLLLKNYEAEGQVINKNFSPEHNTSAPEYDIVSKTTRLKTTYYPPSWSIEISIDGNKGEISVNEEAYGLISVGEKVWCIYSLGRFSKCMFVKAISNSRFSSS